MSSKILLLVLGLVAVSCAFDSKSLLKRFQSKGLMSSFASKSGSRAYNTLDRKRRESEPESPEITDEAAASLIKFFMAAAWDLDKHEVLAGFLEDMSDSDTNLTVVGWQRISDDEGKVKEIHTIELVIPPKPDDGSQKTDDDDDDDDDDEDDERLLPHKEINEMKEMFEPMAQLGVPASVTYEQFDKEGKEEVLIYLDKDELYAHAEGFSIYNKTAISTPQEVSDFIANLKPAALGKPSVLKYEADGKLIVEQSHITPHILGGVIDHHEAPDDILTQSPQIIAEISQQYPKPEIPKQLATRFTKDFPKYKWRVLVDPVNHYITRDVSVTLSYDNFDLNEESDISYLVYGIKKAE